MCACVCSVAVCRASGQCSGLLSYLHWCVTASSECERIRNLMYVPYACPCRVRVRDGTGTVVCAVSVSVYCNISNPIHNATSVATSCTGAPAPAPPPAPPLAPAPTYCTAVQYTMVTAALYGTAVVTVDLSLNLSASSILNRRFFGESFSLVFTLVCL